MTSRKIRNLIYISLLFLPLASCSTTLDAKLVDRAVYRTGSGEILTVQYYELEDHTLNFIKIDIPDAGEMTLPQVLSGSGSKYSNQAAFIWWTKGNEGTLYRIINNGEWDILYRDCQLFEDRNM